MESRHLSAAFTTLYHQLHWQHEMRDEAITTGIGTNVQYGILSNTEGNLGRS